jgi:hypothetical protein
LTYRNQKYKKMIARVFTNVFALLWCMSMLCPGFKVVAQVVQENATAVDDAPTTTYKPCSVCFSIINGRSVPADVLNPDTPVQASFISFVTNDTTCGEIEALAQAGLLSPGQCVAMWFSSLSKKCGCPIDGAVVTGTGNTTALEDAPAAADDDESSFSLILWIVVGCFMGAFYLFGYSIGNPEAPPDEKDDV